MATDRKQQRETFLKAIYESADGSTRAMVSFDALINTLGHSRQDGDRIMDYLRGAGLADWSAFGQVSITHEGILHVEDEQPGSPSGTVQQNTINIGQMSGGQINQGIVNNPVNAADFVPLVELLMQFSRETIRSPDLTLPEHAAINNRLRAVLHEIVKEPIEVEKTVPRLRKLRQLVMRLGGPYAAAQLPSATKVIEEIDRLLRTFGAY